MRTASRSSTSSSTTSSTVTSTTISTFRSIATQKLAGAQKLPRWPFARLGAHPAVSSTIAITGGRLTLGGAPYTFVGVNAYEIGTEWGTNAGCGPMESDAELDQLFSSLPPNSLVRFWALQGTIATNVTTHQLDWAALDRVFAIAVAHHQRLIPVLAGQGNGCDGSHWQDPSWYNGGFQQAFNDPSTTDGRGLTPLSYWDYIQAVVQRYRSSPALGMWEPISEAEASTCPQQFQPTSCEGHQTCPNEVAAAASLRHFYDVVGTEIHALDSSHLVEDGLLGSGQCGTTWTDYQYVSSSSGIDVLSYHDYYGSAVIGGDQWNGEAERFAEARAVGKPIIGGEVGIIAGSASGCTTLQDRADEMRAKVSAQIQAGSSGELIWDWLPSPTTPCTFDTFPGDPLMTAVRGGLGAF